MKIKMLSLLLIVVLFLCGCNTVDETAALSDAINSYIQAECYTGEELPLQMEYQNAILGGITYEIQSVNMKKNTMDVEFTYIDVLALADSITDPDISMDDYHAVCLEKINSKEYSTITEAVCVGFELTGDHYTLVESEELANVLTGGVLDYYFDLLEESRA